MARAGRAGALPVFWQTLLLVVATLVIAQVTGVALLLLAPPPRPDYNRMSDIVAALTGTPDREPDERQRPLLVHAAPGPPPPRPGMVADAGFVHGLAQRLGRPDGEVRLYFEPERRGERPFGYRHMRRPFFVRGREPLFFTPLIAGVATPRGWRVAESPPPPLVPAWQRRMMLWLAVSVVALIPLAGLFARRISRPIGRFAAAADRLGGDPQAPPIPEEGPAELRVTARALNRMQARLADYVGERTAMIGAIAHDLRTPLARIAFRIEGAPEPLREKVLADVEQMRAMLAATIGFVRNTERAGARVPVDLAPLLAAIVEQDRDLGRAVTLGEVAPLAVLGDPLALERLVQNLIDNGIAYGGAVEVSLAREGATAVVRIADRGPGLSPEMLARAFQPFVRGDPSRNRATGGIGLGLTIARTLAEDHGGTLTLANRAEGGLEAVLRLPVAD